MTIRQHGRRLRRHLSQYNGAQLYLYGSGIVTLLTAAALASQGRYIAAVMQFWVGGAMYYTVSKIIKAKPPRRDAAKPRLVIRADGRVCVCVAAPLRPWYEPVRTLCGEEAAPNEALSTNLVTCVECLSAR